MPPAAGSSSGSDDAERTVLCEPAGQVRGAIKRVLHSQSIHGFEVWVAEGHHSQNMLVQ